MLYMHTSHLYCLTISTSYVGFKMKEYTDYDNCHGEDTIKQVNRFYSTPTNSPVAKKDHYRYIFNVASRPFIAI